MSKDIDGIACFGELKTGYEITVLVNGIKTPPESGCQDFVWPIKPKNGDSWEGLVDEVNDWASAFGWKVHDIWSETNSVRKEIAEIRYEKSGILTDSPEEIPEKELEWVHNMENVKQFINRLLPFTS
jgi:hypothetical protein